MSKKTFFGEELYQGRKKTRLKPPTSFLRLYLIYDVFFISQQNSRRFYPNTLRTLV